MRGRITADEDAWLYHKWKPEVDMHSLMQATLPPGPVEDEVDTYEALALATLPPLCKHPPLAIPPPSPGRPSLPCFSC